MLATQLHDVLAGALARLAIGLIGVLQPHNFRLVTRVLFPAGAIVGLAIASVALSAIFGAPGSLILPLGLPDLPFHARLDALSCFFLLLLGSVSAGVSVFAAGYFRRGEGTPPGLQCLYYHVLLGSMALVLVADDADRDHAGDPYNNRQSRGEMRVARPRAT
ncbi:MAG: hypothetical protein HY017_33980 [Betaproteobacteria bacterium]|nr:hypothetical protein [Betaproteobacteria bacterium]